MGATAKEQYIDMLSHIDSFFMPTGTSPNLKTCFDTIPQQKTELI